MNEKQLSTARRSGRSTRIIDELIQELFTKGECIIWDHAHRADANGNPTNMALEHTTNAILSRLYNEHNLKRNAGYIYNKRENKITLSC